MELLEPTWESAIGEIIVIVPVAAFAAKVNTISSNPHVSARSNPFKFLSPLSQQVGLRDSQLHQAPLLLPKVGCLVNEPQFCIFC